MLSNSSVHSAAEQSQLVFGVFVDRDFKLPYVSLSISLNSCCNAFTDAVFMVFPMPCFFINWPVSTFDIAMGTVLYNPPSYRRLGRSHEEFKPSSNISMAHVKCTSPYIFSRSSGFL